MSEVVERVLITGASGFVGRRLVERLALENPYWRLYLPGYEPGQVERLEVFDIVDAAIVSMVVAEHRPTIAIHLAAVSAVTDASMDPRRAWDVNLTGTLNLIAALKEYASTCRLLYVSTSEVYGASLNLSGGTDETALLQPLNTYAASKAAADILVRQASAAGLQAVVVRPFNHTGPGQSETFMVPNFAAQVARIEAEIQAPVINVGDLGGSRDFLDVEDVVSAYISILNNNSFIEPGEVFNVSSGVSRKISQVLDCLIAMSSKTITIRIDPARLRTSGIQNVIGNSSKLKARFQWKPAIDFHKTIAEILNYQRRSIRL